MWTSVIPGKSSARTPTRAPDGRSSSDGLPGEGMPSEGPTLDREMDLTSAIHSARTSPPREVW